MNQQAEKVTVVCIQIETNLLVSFWNDSCGSFLTSFFVIFTDTTQRLLTRHDMIIMDHYFWVKINIEIT